MATTINTLSLVDDTLNPLRHRINPRTIATSTLEPQHLTPPGPTLTTTDEEDIPENIPSSRKSKSELIALLPHQHFFESDGVLDLTFSLTPSVHPDEESIKSQVSVKLVVDAAPGCGGIAWPAGQILSSYLTHTHRTVTPLTGKSIVELGSGTGLVGLIAGKLDESCKVFITDQVPLLDIMGKNVVLNSLVKNVEVVELNWGEPIPENLPSKPDIILAADCVYFEPAFPLLVQTLVDLSDTNTHILFCYKKRRKADKRFFSLLKKKFTWSEVDDLNRGIYNREAISLLRLHKIPERAGAGARKEKAGLMH